MKRVFALFFALVYLSSFAGMSAGVSCNVHQANLVVNSAIQSLEGQFTPPLDHDAHPMLQFCKAVEFHKQVLHPTKAKNWNPSPISLSHNTLSRWNAAAIGHVPVKRDFDSPVQKLFLFNRMLLI